MDGSIIDESRSKIRAHGVARRVETCASMIGTCREKLEMNLTSSLVAPFKTNTKLFGSSTTATRTDGPVGVLESHPAIRHISKTLTDAL